VEWRAHPAGRGAWPVGPTHLAYFIPCCKFHLINIVI
jgi:hypothetical protein